MRYSLFKQLLKCRTHVALHQTEPVPYLRLSRLNQQQHIWHTTEAGYEPQRRRRPAQRLLYGPAQEAAPRWLASVVCEEAGCVNGAHACGVVIALTGRVSTVAAGSNIVVGTGAAQLVDAPTREAQAHVIRVVIVILLVELG